MKIRFGKWLIILYEPTVWTNSKETYCICQLNVNSGRNELDKSYDDSSEWPAACHRPIRSKHSEIPWKFRIFIRSLMYDPLYIKNQIHLLAWTTLTRNNLDIFVLHIYLLSHPMYPSCEYSIQQSSKRLFLASINFNSIFIHSGSKL